MTDSPELISRVHLVTATPWQQAVDCYFNPDDDVDIHDLRFGFPERWDAGDLFVVVTTDSHTPAIIVVEESETASNATRSEEHTSMGPFDFGLSIAAIEARLATTLPAGTATLEPELGERLIQAINAEASDPTSWRELDERGCLAEVADWPGPDSWAPCACCGEHPYDGAEWELHALVDDLEQDFFGSGPLTVCASCHDRLHRPLAPGADDVMFGFRPLCPSCSATRTFQVIWGMPAGPPGPGTDIAGCVITSPFTPEYRCGECDYTWTEDDEAYRPLPSENTATRVRARIATAPPGVYRPFSRVTEPGRIIVGEYLPRQVSSSSAWGPGVVHELFGDDGRTYSIDPSTLRSDDPHTWMSQVGGGVSSPTRPKQPATPQSQSTETRMTNRAVTEHDLGAWVFKCNPDIYDLPAEFADGESFVDGWSVADNYRSQMITAGQRAILWMSGTRDGSAPRGIWGIGWTTGGSYETSGLGGGYWKDDDHAARVRHIVPTAIRILDEPDRLRADDIAAVPDLSDLEVFTVPQGSNPSWISRSQLAALEPLLPPWPAPDDVPLTTVTLGPHGAAFGSPENNALVEQAAMDAVTQYYETHWQAAVDDVHSFNMGWDLTVTTPAGEEWHVEVKGVSGSLPIVLLTANECRVAEHDDAWELAVVTHALSDEPEVTIYEADQVLRNSQPQTVRADMRGEDGWSA